MEVMAQFLINVLNFGVYPRKAHPIPRRRRYGAFNDRSPKDQQRDGATQS